MDKITLINNAFRSVYSPLAKAIGTCLATLPAAEVDATAVISCIMAVAIDVADKANQLAKKENKTSMLVDGDQVARFVAGMIVSTLSVSDPIRKAFESILPEAFDESMLN